MEVMTDPAALEAVPEGEQIEVNSNRLGRQLWTKKGSLFTRDGVEVPVDFFVGYVAEGKVTRNAEDGVGTWYTSGYYDYLLMRLGPAEVWILVFYNGQYHSDAHNTMSWWERNMQSLARSDAMPARVAAQPESVAEVVRQLVGAVRASTPGASKTDQVPVTVRVWGERPSGVKGAPIQWQFQYMYTAEAPVGQCACDTLNRTKVRAKLPRSLHAYGTWDVKATCRYNE